MPKPQYIALVKKRGFGELPMPRYSADASVQGLADASDMAEAAKSRFG